MNDTLNITPKGRRAPNWQPKGNLQTKTYAADRGQQVVGQELSIGSAQNHHPGTIQTCGDAVALEDRVPAAGVLRINFLQLRHQMIRLHPGEGSVATQVWPCV